MRHFFVFVLCSLLACVSAEAKQLALIIANAKYEKLAELTNPINDASAFADVLRRIGFASDEIIIKTNLEYEGMRLAIRDFKRAAAGTDIAIVYFAGHGYGAGENFLIPVDAELQSPHDLRDEAISQRSFEDAVSLASRIKLVIIDACRNDPSAGRISAVATRAVTRGLERVEPDGGVLVAYSAKHGTVAQDGPRGGNSPFAAALAKHFATPGEDIRIVFGAVRDEVMKATSNQQEPFLYGSLGYKKLFLVEGVNNPSPPSLNPDEAAQVWAVVQGTSSEAILEDFVRRFGDSVYGGFARVRLAELKQEKAEEKRERDLQIMRDREVREQQERDRVSNLPTRSQEQNTTQPACGWYAIFSCSPDKGAARLAANRLGGNIVDTSSSAYPNFQRGYFCAVFGPMGKGRASDKAEYARGAGFPTAYIKNAC